MREYRGKRRQPFNRGMPERRGGQTSPGTSWSPGTPPSVDPPAQSPNGSAGGGSGAAGISERNARMANFTFETSTESQQIMPGNPHRIYLAIQNRGSSAVFISFGQKASDSTFRLDGGGFYEPYIAPNTSVNIKGVAGGDKIVVIEGIKGTE